MAHQEAIVGLFADDTEKVAELLARYTEVHDQSGTAEAVTIANEIITSD